jgi:hypothetical protein
MKTLCHALGQKSILVIHAVITCCCKHMIMKIAVEDLNDKQNLLIFLNSII